MPTTAAGNAQADAGTIVTAEGSSGRISYFDLKNPASL
jgi:hypothetical protein